MFSAFAAGTELSRPGFGVKVGFFASTPYLVALLAMTVRRGRSCGISPEAVLGFVGVDILSFVLIIIACLTRFSAITNSGSDIFDQLQTADTMEKIGIWLQVPVLGFTTYLACFPDQKGERHP